MARTLRRTRATDNSGPRGGFHVERSPEETLDAGLSELSLPGPSGNPATVIEGLAKLSRLVVEWGTRLNLTAHRSAEDVARHLILDAAAVLTALPPLPEHARLMDLGSGAGFPGLPLAILRPDIEVLLVEAREKRHHFQRAAVRALRLQNATPLLGRVEALEPKPCAVVIAQAVARPPVVAPLVLPWLRAGSWLAVPGSETATEPVGAKGLGTPCVIPYQVPLQGRARNLWLAQR